MDNHSSIVLSNPLMNKTSADIEEWVRMNLEIYSNNRNIDGPAFPILITLYSFLIILGATGNSLVVIAVIRKPIMRTARNMFIVNLAISDLLLCLVTMPLTLAEILSKYWPLGENEGLCKLISTLQATSIFVSTISITAIALDRYQVIVYPTRDNLQTLGAITILAFIWILSIILASPMFIIKKLIVHQAHLEQFGISKVSYCLEDWPMIHGRAFYSGFSLFVQYLLPILVVSAAYLRIYLKLKGRRNIQQANKGNNKESERDKERERRMKRTNYLLTSIAVIFGISWLPLNLYNLYSDIYLKDYTLTPHQLIVYAVCHMMGMSSACSNPLLYGWLNDNFRKEFNEILCASNEESFLMSGRVNSKRRSKPDMSQVGITSDNHKRLLGSGVTENGLQSELTVLVR